LTNAFKSRKQGKIPEEKFWRKKGIRLKENLDAVNMWGIELCRKSLPKRSTIFELTVFVTNGKI